MQRDCFKIIPLYRRVDSVHYDPDIKKLFRFPVIAMAQAIPDELSPENECLREHLHYDYNSFPRFLEADRSGIIAYPEENDYFLGYEFDGIEVNWENDIKYKCTSLEKRKKK